MTRKSLDYLHWKKIVELKKLGAHKTKEGFEIMLNFKNKMNSRRE